MKSCPIRYFLLVISFVLSIHASAEELPLFGELPNMGKDWSLDTKGEGIDDRGYSSWSWVVFTNSVSRDMMSFVAQTYKGAEPEVNDNWVNQAASDMFAAGGYPRFAEDRQKPRGFRWWAVEPLRWGVTNEYFSREALEYTFIYEIESRDQPNQMGHGYVLAFDNMLIHVQHTSSQPIDSGLARSKARQLISNYEEAHAVIQRQEIWNDPATIEAFVNMKPESLTEGEWVNLLSEAGSPFVGSQLENFNINENGEISADTTSSIPLLQTENPAFYLSGEVNLAGPDLQLRAPSDLPDGFAIFVRETDGRHRYRFDSRLMRAKRRLFGGEQLTNIQVGFNLPVPELGVWYPFELRVSGEKFEYWFNGIHNTVEGPMDIDGGNRIGITPGTKLRNLRIQLVED